MTEGNMEYNRNIEMARRIAEKVAEAGGTVYYVGGMVRDCLMGVGQKAPDVDIEVHGILPEQLEAILDTLGERQMFGASFGIYNLRHYDIDIAMPRKEKRTGERRKICMGPLKGLLIQSAEAGCRSEPEDTLP